MISLLTLLIVLATTLAVASPLPEPESELAQRYAPVPQNLVPTHELVKVGTEKMVDFDCIGPNDKAFLPKEAAMVAFDGLAKLANSNKTIKPKNKQGKTFPRHFHFKGESTNIMKDLSNDCKQHQANTTYLQNPVGSAKHVFKDGAESGPDRILALAHGKWPKYTKVVYCGLITHRGQNDAKVYRVCQKKKASK